MDMGLLRTGPCYGPFFFCSTASKSTSSTSVNRHRRHRLADIDDVDFEVVKARLWWLWKSRCGGCVVSAFGGFRLLTCLHNVIDGHPGFVNKPNAYFANTGLVFSMNRVSYLPPSVSRHLLHLSVVISSVRRSSSPPPVSHHLLRPSVIISSVRQSSSPPSVSRHLAGDNDLPVGVLIGEELRDMRVRG